MSIEILPIKDNPGDIRLTQEAFRDVNTSVRLHVASDGLEAMAFPRGQGDHIHAPRPDLILLYLYLNLPKTDGREVLAHIKKEDCLKAISTVVLTTSESEADIVIGYQLQANCYLGKPTQWDALDRPVRSVNEFWLTRVKLPQQKRGGDNDIHGRAHGSRSRAAAEAAWMAMPRHMRMSSRQVA